VWIKALGYVLALVPVEQAESLGLQRVEIAA
jgi:hypothetical protein